MTKPLELTGQVFGRLTVLGRGGTHPKSKKAFWRCRCECGREKEVLGTYLRLGQTRSCGCLFLETTIAKGRAKGLQLAGKFFGRLVAIRPAGKTSKGEIVWLCECS